MYKWKIKPTPVKSDSLSWLCLILSSKRKQQTNELFLHFFCFLATPSSADVTERKRRKRNCQWWRWRRWWRRRRGWWRIRTGNSDGETPLRRLGRIRAAEAHRRHRRPRQGRHFHQLRSGKFPFRFSLITENNWCSKPILSDRDWEWFNVQILFSLSLSSSSVIILSPFRLECNEISR